MSRRLPIFLFFIFLLCLFTKPLMAQRRGDLGIGKVDMYVVLLLHPSMLEYNVDKQAFAIQRDKVSQQKAKNERSANENEINKLAYSMKQLKARLIEEERNYTKKVNEINNNKLADIKGIATGPAAITKKTYEQSLNALEAKYYGSVTSLQAQYSMAEEKLLRLQEFGFNEGYTTPEETEQRFAYIESETMAYIKRIADQKGISIVLNSGYKRLLNQYRTSNIENIAQDYALGTIFKTSFPRELVQDKGAVQGYYESIERKTINWLENAGPILNRMRSKMASNDVILGGVDLTAEVIASLYKAYKLDPNITNAIIQSAQRF